MTDDARGVSELPNSLLDRPVIPNASRDVAARLLRQVGSASAIRHICSWLLDQDELARPGISPLFAALNDPSPWKCDERELAVWCLGFVPVDPDESRSIVESLSAVLNDPDPFRKWRSLLDWVSLIGTFSLGLAASVSAAFDLLRFYVLTRMSLAALFAIVTVVLIPSKLLARTLDSEDGPYHRIRAAAATALGNRGNLNAISALAAALFDTKIQSAGRPVRRFHLLRAALRLGRK